MLLYCPRNLLVLKQKLVTTLTPTALSMLVLLVVGQLPRTLVLDAHFVHMVNINQHKDNTLVLAARLGNILM